MLIKHITNNYKQTQKIGESLAKTIMKNGLQKKAVVLALYGNLGGGKTTFLQGFAKGLNIKEKILSPTFVIQKKFKIPNPKSKTNSKSKIQNIELFYHFDCYRLNNPAEILELDFKSIIKNPENIIAIEWPEKIKKLLPRDVIKIDFTFINKNKREIKF